MNSEETRSLDRKSRKTFYVTIGVLAVLDALAATVLIVKILN